MSTSETPRLRIAQHGTAARPYAHLLPILEAELAWGNRYAYGYNGFKMRDYHFRDYEVRLKDPLHLDRLRATFQLPESVGFWATPPRGPKQPGTMSVGDTDGQMLIVAALPPDWSGGEGRLPWDPEEPTP
jgi:hypothetical protein